MFPANPVFSIPFVLAAGLFERLDNMVKRIRVAPAFSDNTGALLGINPSTPPPTPPDSVKPAISTFPVATGYLFSVVVTNRGDSDQWQVSAAVVGTANWQAVATATGKSTDVTYSGGSGQPVQLQVRVQLRKNNADYGQMSDIALATVNPLEQWKVEMLESCD